MVRAKFTVTEIRQHKWHPTARTVVLEPQYDPTIEEDRRFASATPTGRLRMFIDNPRALDQFPIGSVHYLDFTLATA